jgi:di/tricarboxylate transporter
MTATRVLNAAGTKPSVVLLVLMFVATFASMWISNVAAPTLCYALIKVGRSVTPLEGLGVDPEIANYG